MFTYASRAVPWTRVALAAALVLVLLGLVRWDSWLLWPLEGIAVGLVSAAVGWCLDEPAAAVVDSSPRGLAWRCTARLPGIVVVMAAWTIGVWWARASLFDHAAAILGQGVAGAIVGAAWVISRRSAGEATPGLRWAITVVPVTVAWALMRPLQEHFPVFPYGIGDDHGNWHVSAVIWSAAAVCAVVVLGASLARDGRPVWAVGLGGGI